jgi:hypothetical protein
MYTLIVFGKAPEISRRQDFYVWKIRYNDEL